MLALWTAHWYIVVQSFKACILATTDGGEAAGHAIRWFIMKQRYFLDCILSVNLAGALQKSGHLIAIFII